MLSSAAKRKPRRAETDCQKTCTEVSSGRAPPISVRRAVLRRVSPQTGFVVFPRGRREILYLDNAMSASVLVRSLLCLLALGGVAALQVRPESSRLAAPRPVLRATTLVAAAAAAEDEGKAGLSASTANLVKSIVGSGVLSLPVGVAAFSSARTAILPALTLLAVAGAISGYCKRHATTPIASCTARTGTHARTMHRLHFSNLQASPPSGACAPRPVPSRGARRGRSRWARARRGCPQRSSASLRSR